MPNSRRIIVIVKLRPFDEAVWKRLLTAYAYALYYEQKQRTKPVIAESEGGTP